MSRPYNIATPRPGKDGKTYWDSIGTAWPNDKGGFRLNFTSLPIGSYSEQYGYRVEAMIFPPKDDNGGSRQNNDLNDEIPDF